MPTEHDFFLGSGLEGAQKCFVDMAERVLYSLNHRPGRWEWVTGEPHYGVCRCVDCNTPIVVQAIRPQNALILGFIIAFDPLSCYGWYECKPPTFNIQSWSIAAVEKN